MEIIILILALGLRLIGIGQSLWLDEAISANVAKMPIGEIVRNFSIGDFHPPFYYWFLDLWTEFFGSHVIMLRLGSVLFSLITIYFVYLIGKKIKNKKIGILAALFLAINPLFVYYSQELRMYSMATMWLIIGFYYFVKIKSKKYLKRDLVIFNLMMGLAFGTFYGSIFLIASFAIYFLIKKEWKLFWLTNIGTGLAIIILTPLLLTQIKNSQIMLVQVTNWTLVLGKVNLKNLLLIPLKFGVGKISFYPKIWYYLIGGIWSLIILGLILKNKKESNWLKIFLGLPIFLAILFSIKSPLLQYFRFLYLVPIMCLVLAINCDKKWQKILIGGGFLIFSSMYLLNPNYYREDWKSVATKIENEKSVYMIESFSDPIKFYNPKMEIKDIKTITPTENEIWVIPFGEAIHGINLEEKLKNLGYKRIVQKDFREMELEKWEK
ncbi:MAG: glycosyltransferase family 39 protein [Candidatus Shapirobacteria bacterium]|nr:glycosyltransferase family 39 protein [Candidatus Shapirobacteria bacterium]MDD3002434.1 glycosyltransferase family 39 protein [Candidatus Shapirobacteria bacterium]MDD4383449.1 glycosyltransferase family 39 protein [Candidatus Shapirobacteria bacterium]